MRSRVPVLAALVLLGATDAAAQRPPVVPRRGSNLVLPPHRRRPPERVEQRPPAVTPGKRVDPSPAVGEPEVGPPARRDARVLVAALTDATAAQRATLAAIVADLRALGKEAVPELRRGLDTRRTVALFTLVDLLRELDPEEGYAFVRARALEGLSESSARRLHVLLRDWRPADARARLLEWLAAGARGLRTVAAEELAKILDPALLADVRRLAERGESGPARAAALRFLIERALPEVEVLCARGLRDESPLVARAAVEGYVLRATEATWSALLQHYREVGHDVSWGRTCVALVELEEARHRELFTEEDYAVAIAATAHPDLFVRSAGALVATVIARRSERDDLLPVLAKPLPHALVQAVGGLEGHPELPLVRPAIYRVLAGLSGENLGARGDAWRAWWLRQHLAFEPRRSLLPLDPAPEVRIRRTTPQGTALDVTFVPWKGESVAPSAGTYYLDERLTEQMLDAIRALGLHRGRWTSGLVGERGETLRSIELVAGAQSKRIEVADSEAPAAELAPLHTLLDALEAQARGLVWQAFPDGDAHADASAFLAAHFPRFHALADDAQRARFLREIVIGAVDDLDVERRLEAFFVFRDTLAPQERLAQAEAEAVLAALQEVALLGRGDRAFLDLVAERADGVDLERLKLWFAQRPISEEGTVALASLLAQRGSAAVRGALQDERVPVLAAAVEAASSLGEDAPLEDLLLHATSREWAVRIAAIHSLGRLEALGAAPLLVRRFAAAGYAERLEIAEAAARIGGGASLDLIRLELEKEDRLMRRAIFQGLELSSSPEAAIALATFAVARGRYSEAGRRARQVFLHKPREVIRRVGRALLSSTDPAFRRGVAVLLAEAYDREALEPLVAAIRLDPTDRELMDAYERLSCERVDLDRWPYMASDFLETHRGEQPSQWFAAALQELGHAVPEELHHESRLALSPSTVEVLVEALRAPAWPLRLHAVRYLEEHFETTFGDLAPETRLGDFAVVADEVRALLRARAAGNADGDR